MLLLRVLPAGLLVAVSALSATDPFVGTWLHNTNKSPKPTITFTIRDVGGDQVALTGSTGKSITLMSDGTPGTSSPGVTTTLRKLDNRHWEERRVSEEIMMRDLSVSDDDQTMTLVDTYKFADGNGRRDITKYSRLSAGHGLFGEWQSFSMTSDVLGAEGKIVVQPFGKAGLSFIGSDSDRLDINFDGRKHASTGPHIPKSDLTAGKRAGLRLLRMEEYVDGELDERDEYRISDDGKTLTIIARPVKIECRIHFGF